ncbi:MULTISPECIES: hypothetical protein [Streptomyces]|nr:hypothetical protein [Streptomyces laculatispora]WSS87986.1 hypothetical protein OG199_35560 [Streptomyces sp. NBC_01176]
MIADAARTLKEAAVRRELGTAHRPVLVPITRIQHTSPPAAEGE